MTKGRHSKGSLKNWERNLVKLTAIITGPANAFLEEDPKERMKDEKENLEEFTNQQNEEIRYRNSGQ